MNTEQTPAPWNRGPVASLYFVLVIVSIAVLRFAGRGWIGAITAGIVVAGVVTVLLVLLGTMRSRRSRRDDGEER